MRTVIRIFFFIFFGSIVSSCVVSKKKFDDMVTQKTKAEADVVTRSNQLDKANAANSALGEKLKQLKKDTADLAENYRASYKKLTAQTKEYDQLNGLYKSSITNSGQLNRDVMQQKDQLLAIQSNLDLTRKQNDSLSFSLSEREKKIQELERILAEKDKAVADLKTRITNALLNFKENDLTVTIKNGKVYVSLAEQLLFKSGSTEVDPKGIGALQQLAKVLKDQSDLQVMVEGHTDNVPVSRKSPYMRDNWDLSVLRATSITRILTAAGVPTAQIVASGKGEFYPMAANDSPQNKQRNRRTEIIITPNLDELFKILGAN